MPLSLELWNKLAGEWKPDLKLVETRMVDLDEIHTYIERIFKGGITGRVVLKHR